MFGVWAFNYNAIIHINLNFKNLHRNLIEKYNLMDYGIIDKNKIWLNFSIWNTLIYLLNYSWLVISFLVFKFENQNIFVVSLILIIVGNNICLLLEFIISFFIYKKYHLKNKGYINQNIEKFKNIFPSFKYINVEEFNKNKIYIFRDKIYQKFLNKALNKVKEKTKEKLIIKHYIIFLRYAHFLTFNLMRSNITFKNDDLFKISDQILNNLMFKIHNNYLLKIIHIKQ